MADPSLAEAVALPPAEAIAFFRQKTNTTSRHWTDLWNEAHSRSFMVAGAASDALVADFRAAVTKAIEQGTTLAEFRRDFDSIVAKHGWVYNGTPGWRSQIIYETNLSMAYAAGRYAQMTEPATLQAFPFWEYMHTSSIRPRPQHLAWVGTVLAADNAWWGTHYPPNGWRCRCWVRPLSRAGLSRRGKSGPDQAPPVDLRPWRNPHTGAVVPVPHGVDPGFGYNPGAAWLDGSPPPLTGGPAPAPRVPRIPPAQAVPPAAEDFADWARSIVSGAASPPDGSMREVATIPAAVRTRLAELGAAPQSDTIEVTATRLRHLARGGKASAGRALLPADVQRLPELMAAPRAVLRDRSTGALVYVLDLPARPGGRQGPRLGKVVVKLGTRGKRGLVNAIATAGLESLADLRRTAVYELLDGTIAETDDDEEDGT